MNEQKRNKQNSNEVSYLIEREQCPFAVTESYKTLATNISFAIPQKENGRGKIVCIVSSISDEGKTTVSCNLAVTIATSGAKTVLVDCDFRKHNIYRYMKIRTKIGIASYLSESHTIDEVLIKDVVPNLDVLGCEKSVPNPAVLLGSEHFAKLIEALEQRYDYVIIDSPPVGVVSDALLIAPKCDGTVIVVRSMLTTHKMLMQSISSLDFAGCNILGFALKESLENSKEYHYGKRYYYYGDNDKEKDKNNKM